MIFLDSDILSYFFSGNLTINKKITETINTGEKISLTIINVYELLKGFKWRSDKNKELLFIKFLKTVPVFSIDNDTINLAADIYADLRKNGITISDADIMIASIIIKNNGKLVTNNVKHYCDIKDLKLINWLYQFQA